MAYFIFQEEQWLRVVAIVFISCTTLSVFAMVLGIGFTFMEIKPADRFLTSCGFANLVGLFLGLVTSPRSFTILVTFSRGNELPQ